MRTKKRFKIFKNYRRDETYLTAVMNGESPEVCAQLAAAEGAASVSAYDALGGILTLDELKRRIATGWKTMEE